MEGADLFTELRERTTRVGAASGDDIRVGPSRVERFGARRLSSSVVHGVTSTGVHGTRVEKLWTASVSGRATAPADGACPGSATTPACPAYPGSPCVIDDAPAPCVRRPHPNTRLPRWRW